MAINPSAFDNVKVLRIPVASPQKLFEVTGEALVEFSTDSQDSADFVRDDLVFVVPREDGGEALNVGHLVDSAVDAFVATAQSNVGWGVDTAESVVNPDDPDGKTVQVTARVALAGEGVIERIGFRVSILAF